MQTGYRSPEVNATPEIKCCNLLILLASIVQGFAFDLAAPGLGQGPVVVEQGRLPTAVGGVGQHPPAFAEPVAVLVEQRGRSEEHTSELQSLMRISYAVYCLKKKKMTDTN